MQGNRIIIIAFVVLLSLIGCNKKYYKTEKVEYKKLSATEINSVINSIPYSDKIGYSGVNFFNESLFASSNIGIIEFRSSNEIYLHKWYKRGDVISGPWFGENNQSIWFFHNGIFKFIQYDGKIWKLHDMPRHPKGHFSRGDILSGFRGVSNKNNFWLQGGGIAWRWNKKENKFIVEELPSSGYFESVLPVKGKFGVIMRKEYLSDLLFRPFEDKPTVDNSDFLYIREGDSWKAIKNSINKYFYARDITVGSENSYILTEHGEILEVNEEEIRSLEVSGHAEAITITSTGNILISVHNQGIYEYVDKKWQKRFDCPYPNNELLNDQVFLAESKGRVFLTVTASFDDSKNSGKWMSRAWKTVNGKFVEILY